MRKAQGGPTEQSGVCGPCPGKRQWSTTAGSGSDYKDHRPGVEGETGHQRHSPLAPAPHPQEGIHSLFPYHLPE